MQAAEDLSTLVVDEGGVAAERLDDALQRQVLSGGALDTVLLEMGLVDEPTALRLLSRAEGLPAVGRDAIDGADSAAVAMFPRRLAEKHGIVPLELSGRTLSVAVAEAPDMARLDEIGFMLSVYVRPYVTTELRVHYALPRLYGIPLPRRMQNLLGMLGEEPATGDYDDDDEFDEESVDVGSAGDGWSVVSAGLVAPDDGASSPPAAAGPAQAESGMLSGGTDEGARGREGEEQPLSVEEARARLLKRLEEEEEKERAREDERRKKRVRWTVDDAIAELALTEDRDEMLDVALRFAYRRLQSAAVFVVQRHEDGPVFTLWDIIDPEFSRRDFKQVAIPATGDSVLARVRDMKSPVLGPLTAEDPLSLTFGRLPRAAVLVPVIVGDVLAGVLYGDNGDKAIPPSSLAELHMVVPRLGKALRNLILRRKRARAAEEEREAEEAARDVVAPKAEAQNVPVVDVDLGLDSDEDEAELDAALDSMSALDDGSFAERPPEEEIDAADLDQEVGDEVIVAASATPPPAPQHSGEMEAWADDPDAVEEDIELDISIVSREGAPVSDDDAPVELPSAGPAQAPEPVVAEPAARPSPPPLPKRKAKAAAKVARIAGGPAPSPGADARESVLLATWRDWLRHEDAETDELVGALHQPGDAGRVAINAVVARGPRSMPSVARYFPGVLSVHPFGPMPSRPSVEQFSDATACLAKLGAGLAAPILIGELDHEDRLHRYTAVWCLSQLKVPAALPRLAQRAFDPEARVAMLALEVLPQYAVFAGYEKVVAWLREYCRRGDEFQRTRAVVAAAELKDTGALDHLINLLGTRPKEVAEEAHRALVEITRQDFALSERRWRAWVADHQEQPRLHWVVEGLAHKEASIRAAAFAELQGLSRDHFGYRPEASRKEREPAVEQWQAWAREQDEAAT
jgi:hypothetical protein